MCCRARVTATLTAACLCVADAAVAQPSAIQLDASLRDPVFRDAIVALGQVQSVSVSMRFASMDPPRDEEEELDWGGLELELTRDHAGVYRLVDDVTVLLRAQYPVVPSWASIARRAEVGRFVACRVLYGEPIAAVSLRASAMLAARGRTVSASAIEQDLRRLPEGLRLSTAMIVPMAQWGGGAQFEPFVVAPPEALAPNARGSSRCLAFRARRPMSSAYRGGEYELRSVYPESDQPSALGRCWGPHGEWALGITDRSYMRWSEDEPGVGEIRRRINAILAYWPARGAPQTRGIDGSVNEERSMLGAYDLDGDGRAEALVSVNVGGEERVEIYSVRKGRIVRWPDGPSAVRTVGDADLDGVQELFAPYRIGGGEDPYARGEPLELWQRVARGRFSNRTPLSRLFMAQQCPAIPRRIDGGPGATRAEIVGNIRCARMRGLSAEETVYRVCSVLERACQSPTGSDYVSAAREDVPYWL